MKMTIKESWPEEPLGRYNPHKPVNMGESGYASVEEMRKELRRRFPDRQTVDIPNGIACREHSSWQGNGLLRALEITLS